MSDYILPHSDPLEDDVSWLCPRCWIPTCVSASPCWARSKAESASKWARATAPCHNGSPTRSGMTEIDVHGETVMFQGGSA